MSTSRSASETSTVRRTLDGSANGALREHTRAESPRNVGGLHWESWLLRGLLFATLGVQLVRGNQAGAIVAAIGIALSLLPPLISRLSKRHTPRMLDVAFTLAIVLQFVSESFKLFEIFTYWDKIVHTSEIFLATGVVTFLFLGYRHIRSIKLPDGLAAAFAMLFGVSLGAAWELIEFAADWFGNANLQKSNADTMTDVLTNNAGAIFGALAFFWLYRHRASKHVKEEFGRIAVWLTGRLGHAFERHGKLIGVLVALFFAAVIGYGWYMDRRPLPPPPTGQAGPVEVSFADESAASAAPIAVLSGDWQARPGTGLCRVNPEDPQPGSEKMGLVALGDPNTSFGSTLTASTRYHLERPPLGTGTQMDAGLAFGIRDPENFYVLHVSALHDVVALDRYVHGVKREQREVHRITRGEEWHTLQVRVDGDRVVAGLDGQDLFEETGLVATDGGAGLWARVSAAGCFAEAAAVPNG